MSSVKIEQTSLFKRTVKKMNSTIIKVLNEEIKGIADDPKKGELKKGDLAGVRVHKFKAGSSLYLLGYTVIDHVLTLLSIGSHENYYRNLKNYLNR